MSNKNLNYRRKEIGGRSQENTNNYEIIINNYELKQYKLLIIFHSLFSIFNHPLALINSLIIIYCSFPAMVDSHHSLAHPV